MTFIYAMPGGASSGGGSSGIAEAPVDNNAYVRKNAAWVAIPAALLLLTSADLGSVTDSVGQTYDLGTIA